MTDSARILVVDDDFATRLLATEALLEAGFEAVEAESGDEAVERFDQAAPDAILLDVNLPGCDGYEVCRRVRMWPGGNDVAVMMMTASDDPAALQQAFAAGATDFMTKPLDLPLLAHRIRFMLRANEVAIESRAAAERVAHLAFYDDVTNLPNLAFLERALATHAKRTWTVIAIDLGTRATSYAPIADRDELMQTAAQHVARHVEREELLLGLDPLPLPDAGPASTLVVRTGVDELVVALVDAPAPAALARELVALLAGTQARSGDLRLHPRAGIATAPDPVGSVGELIDCARRAVALAKPIPLHDVATYTAGVRDRERADSAFASALAAALDRASTGDLSRLAASYEPVRSAAGTIVGVRLRPRWLGDDDRADAFAAAVACDRALAPKLARWSIERACSDAAANPAWGDHWRVAIGVPYGVAMTEPFLASARACAAIARIDLELSELPSDVVELQRNADAVASWRELGVRLVYANADTDCSVAQLVASGIEVVQIAAETASRRGRIVTDAFARIVRGLGLGFGATRVDSPAALAELEPYTLDEISGTAIGRDAMPSHAAPDPVEARYAPPG